MRVLIDGRKLSDGGIGDYISGLVSGLVEAGVYVGLVVTDEAQLPSFLKPSEVFEDPANPYSVDELFALPRRLPVKDFDLYHSPHYTLPFGLPVPSIVTIHDLIHVTHGQAWYYKYAALPQIACAALRASGIFCVSEFTAGELCRFVPKLLINRKLSVTPNVISDRYLLAVVSTDKPHKGAQDLLTAWGLIAHQLDRYRLILVGAGSDRFSGERVVPMGKVSDEKYSSLFRGAEVLVVPSLIEGFCVPALRAVYEGVPVVARPIPALKELLGATGIFADSMTIEDLAAAIYASVQGGPAASEQSQQNLDKIIERCGPTQVTAKVIIGYNDAICRTRGRR
jgi:glycosyltransferase involved in cell wall biosynthesis